MSKGALLRDNRAVSEIVASLILLLIVVVLGTFLYGYAVSLTGEQSEAFKGEIATEAERAQERFRVLAVWWDGSSGDLNLTILNYGRLDIEIADVYVNGKPIESYYVGQRLPIYTSQLGRISFRSPVSVSEGSLYEIVLVSGTGVSHVYRWEC
jgi:flagellin-like protein